MFEVKLKEYADDGIVRVTLGGEVDIAAAPEFKVRLYDIIGEGEKDIELFCEELMYIDSTGLGILVGALKKVKNHQGNVYIYQLRDNIRKLFHITGLDKVFILEEKG